MNNCFNNINKNCNNTDGINSVYIRKEVNGRFITISDDPVFLKDILETGEPVLLILTEENRNTDTSFIRYAIEIDSQDFEILKKEYQNVYCKYFDKLQSESTDLEEACSESVDFILSNHNSGKFLIYQVTPFNESIISELVLQNLSDEYLNLVISRCKNEAIEIVRTHRIIIRELSVKDYVAVSDLYDDNNVEFIESFFSSRDEAREILKSYINNIYGFYNFGIWGIYSADNNEFIGIAGFTPKEITDFEKLNQDETFETYIYKNGVYSSNINTQLNIAKESEIKNDICVKIANDNENANPENENDYYILELGYAILEKYRGNGFGSEACKAVIKYANENIDYSFIFAHIKRNNIPSLRLIKKLHFDKFL